MSYKSILMVNATMACCALAGCATVPAPADQLKPPASRLMQKADALPSMTAGDDLYAANVQCRATYADASGKLTSLQTYVRTVLKKR